MTGRFFLAALFSSSILGCLGCLGCAVADGDVDGVTPRRFDTAGSEDEDTGSPSLDTGSSDTSSTEDSGSAGGDTGSDDTGSTSGTPCTTLTSSDCSSSAEVLTGISGDKGGTATTSGTDSKFVRIRVSEDDSSAFSSKDLRAQITLTSTGANFDLHVYMGKSADDGGGFECTTIARSASEALGSPDVVSLMWSDKQGLGGHDDTRYLTIEVRAADASCAGASWSLTVEGNK